MQGQLSPATVQSGETKAEDRWYRWDIREVSWGGVALGGRWRKLGRHEGCLALQIRGRDSSGTSEPTPRSHAQVRNCPGLS